MIRRKKRGRNLHKKKVSRKEKKDGDGGKEERKGREKEGRKGG